MSQHSSLSPAHWSTFTLDQQILMIGNEMNRATRLLTQAETAGLASPMSGCFAWWT